MAGCENMNTFFRLVPSETPLDASADPQGVPRPDPSAANPAGARPVSAPAKRSLRVLCVDDDEMVLEGMKDFILYFGHRAGMASGGKHALEMFRTAILQNEPFDVVITDMNMPEVDGYALAQMIKAESPNTPVILFTGAGDTVTDSQPSSACVDIVLLKPIRMQELNDAILQSVNPA
jgi:CheY-like chemotaxis protein